MRRKHDTQPAVPTPYDAFKHLVYSYGPEDMARQLLMRVGTLYNKADADSDSHNQPTLRDVVRVTQVSKNYLVLDALEFMFNRTSVDLNDMAHLSDDALLELLTRLGRESGEFHAALHNALQAKQFSRDAYERVRLEAHDMVSALMTLLARVEGLVDE